MLRSSLAECANAVFCVPDYSLWMESFEKTVFSPSHDHSLRVCWNASTFVSPLTWYSSVFAFHVCQRDCQMSVKMESYWQWPWYFLAFYIPMWCNTLKQLTVCHHASPSFFLSATTTMRQQTEPGLVVFGVVWDRKLFTVCENIADIANSQLFQSIRALMAKMVLS